MASELRETIPTFGEQGEGDQEVSLSNWSALTSSGLAGNWRDALVIVAVAAALILGAEVAVRTLNIPSYTRTPCTSCWAPPTRT